MKGRSYATFGCIVLSGWLLAGCAGNQTLPDRADSFDFGNRPQVVIAGATHSDVKGLAMGAARSKGWTIVRSTDDLLVMQRPLDPAAPSAVNLGATTSVVPPVIEVTAAFSDQSGGIKVALAATLITQPPGEQAPKRADYTENYRDALTQSLDSLRANWTANRQRVANAIPPQLANPEPPPYDTAPSAERAGSRTQAWGDNTERSAPSVATMVPTPERAAPPPNPEPSLPPGSGTRDDQEATVTLPYSESTPVHPSQPLALDQSPAPVVDGSTAMVDRSPAPTPGQQPQMAPEPVMPQNEMLTLNQAGGTGIWAYTAEQYARLHGCAIPDSGAQLIERRTDGEIHKVSCLGSDSYLLKCENGVCRELAATRHKPTAAEPMATKPAAKPARPDTQTAKPEAKNSKAATDAAKANTRTAKADAKAARPEVKTAKTDAKTPKPDAKNAKTDAKAPKPDAKNAKTDAKTPKPDAKTAKTDAKTPKPDAKTAKTDAKTPKPDAKTAKAEAKTAKPGAKTAKTDTKTAKPDAKTDMKAAKGSTKPAKTDAKSARPGAKTARAG